MKGVYVLVITVSKDIEVEVGALGKIDFKKGSYAYVGSAQKGLENRVSRHLTGVRHRNFWHVDYLLDNDFAKVAKVFYKVADKSVECKIAEKLKKKGVPMANFGCSDCTCESHLFKITDYDFLGDFMSEIQLHGTTTITNDTLTQEMYAHCAADYLRSPTDPVQLRSTSRFADQSIPVNLFSWM